MNTIEIQQKLGNAIRELRQQNNISQEELAFRCDLHRTYIGSVERGERNISLQNIVNISNVLGINASVLLEKAGL